MDGLKAENEAMREELDAIREDEAHGSFGRVVECHQLGYMFEADMGTFYEIVEDVDTAVLKAKAQAPDTNILQWAESYGILAEHRATFSLIIDGRVAVALPSKDTNGGAVAKVDATGFEFGAWYLDCDDITKGPADYLREALRGYVETVEEWDE